MAKIQFYVRVILLIGTFYLFEFGSGQGQRYIGNAVHKDYPGMCFYNDTQTPIEIGSTFRPTSECVEIKCREDFTLQLLYCPYYNIGKGCKVTINKGVEFPECCVKITCPNKFP
ncbi:uncharacterized protein LOC129912243 [Episyrphus balteatus]|uniref:uncharacterized protein LOC129912243 n=1 Tax=Episyrphus balteatus TaxID=286459 RepID=UPI0024852A51|nr:uncharacterized protein LOC129912243 [Episyrphus balteatus]